jgi:hypothetical protein
MTSRRIAGLTFVVAVACVATTIVLARGQATTRPGDPTQARVWVENRNRTEAIPVRLDQPVIETVSARQRWEYRSVTMPPGADPARIFNASGVDGWEAVGVLQVGATTSVLFKRPLSSRFPLTSE